MKRILIFVYAAVLVIVLANAFYYRNLYDKQLNYITTLLSRQVQIVGLAVDSTNNYFTSDLNKIIISDDLSKFFSDKEKKYIATEDLKLYFSKYQDFIVGIRLYDNNKHEFTLKKDSKTGEWLEQQYVLHDQGEIFPVEQLVQTNKKFEYYLPVFSKDATLGDIVVIVDYQKYFNKIFSEFNLKDYQWQWVIGDSSEIVFSNINAKSVTYSQLDRLNAALESESYSYMMHTATIDGRKNDIISAYYSTQLLQRNLGLIFSARTEFFQKYIIRNSILIVLLTLFLIQVIILIFWRYYRSQSSENKRLAESEKMLFRLIEEMPVGVIIHNRNREIIKANKVAAAQYSFRSEEDMQGKMFPEISVPEVSEYFSKNLGGAFNPDQFVIIKKEIGEMVLFRNSIPVVFKGNDATMEILIDVTMLESARKQEAKANIAKSEFLARMSYEIRTPLNGIIGMTDILNKQDVSNEVRDLISILRRSTEVLLNIINDILDFSKIETGKMILDEIPFNLREEISFCTDLANTHIADKDVTFSYSVDDKIPESIIADSFRLRQILTNLIIYSASNTTKGEIKLECNLKSDNSGLIRLEFQLLDTSPGADKATFKKLFGDYINRESKAVKPDDETGFSTILARQLVEMMGGELNAESPSGLAGDKGTKITFTITAYSNDRITKNINTEKIRSFDMVRTLIISGSSNRDDEILSSLHRIGLIISVTTYQKSTISQIKANLGSAREKYNLIVILDDQEFDGFEVAHSLWENNLSGSLFIIMISGNDKKGNYMKCVTSGVDHYLLRPLDNKELMDVIVESFPFIDHSSLVDISDIRNDIRILVVEDNKMNQKVIGIMLKTLGFTYDVAEDGYQGFMMAKENKYDLIFMDLIMPEMNGYDSARKILAFDKSVLIAAFTADNAPDAKRKAELSGIKEFIAKPVRIEELKRLFAKYFKKSKA